ncbi:unnamed protein product [Phytophthora fragariaefolia]|uniref:Unnamed protein product n=1 Tax=Phytophthora fragariaefolia TaxID=1490495 RepID=A0A9W6WL58_9STRA|nr:unnamed protein product [Phytophthora fragariaefolia]
MIAEFTLRRKQPSEDTHEFWVRRTKDWVPTVAHSSRGKPTRVLLTNASGKPVWCPAHFPVILWTAHGELPPHDGYVRLNSAKYSDWQVLAYEAAMDKDLLKREQQLYADWLARQPPAVERRQYAAPKDVMKRIVDNSATDPAEFECSANEIDLEDYTHELAFLPDLTDSASTVLDYGGSNVVYSAHTPSQREKLVKVLKVQEGIMIASGNALPPPAYGAICDIDVQGHKPIKQRTRRVPLKHLKKLYELFKGLLMAGLIAFSNSPWALPIVIVLKKNGVDIRLCIDYKMLDAITVLMEYAMPLVDDLLTELESYLWFCSLDAASGFWAVMMTQRAREISAFVCALGHFEWLRMPFGLKNAPMIYQRIIDNALWGYVQPRGGWASYAEKVRRAEAASATQRGRLNDSNQPTPDSVNSATKFDGDHRALAESDPLQDLVNSPESDMFANGEPDESTLTPVFDRRSFVDDICFGGTTFEDYLATLSRLIARFAEANPAKLAAIAELPFPTWKKGMQGFLGALKYYSRFIQNMAVYGAVLYQLKDADFADGGDLAAAKLAFAELKTKVVNAPLLRHFESARENEVNCHPAEKEVLALLQILKVGHTLFAGKTLHVYTRFSTLEWVFTSKSLYGRAVSFAVLLSPYHLKVKRIREHDADFAQLLQATVPPLIGLDESPSHLAPPSKDSATVRLDPELLYAYVPRDFVGHVLSFDGSAKTEKNGGYGSCSWILWSLPSWDIVIAASAHLPSTTVNIAEYIGMNNGVMAALERGLTDRIIVGDSRLAIQQSMGVVACKKGALQLELARHKKLTDQLSSVRFLHVLRHYNAAADSLATEALESKMERVVLSSDRKTELKKLNRVSEILYTSTDSADSGKPRAEMTVMTRRETRRVHFEDEANKASAGISQNTGLRDKEAKSSNSRTEGLQFESPRPFIRVRRVEDQAEVEVSEDRIPDATDIDPAVVQAERRRRISKAQDEELRWA